MRYSTSWDRKNQAHAKGKCVQCGHSHDRKNSRTGIRARTCDGCAKKIALTSAARYQLQKQQRWCVCKRRAMKLGHHRCVLCIREAHPTNKRGVQPTNPKETAYIELKLAWLPLVRKYERAMAGRQVSAA